MILLWLCYCIILFLKIIFTKKYLNKIPEDHDQKATSTRRPLMPEGQYQKVTFSIH